MNGKRKPAVPAVGLIGVVFKLLWQLLLPLLFIVAGYLLLPYLIVLFAIPVLLFFTGAISKAAFGGRRGRD